MIGKGKPYKFYASKATQIQNRHGEKALFCTKCKKRLRIGQMVRRGGARSRKWYHDKCFEKTRY